MKKTYEFKYGVYGDATANFTVDTEVFTPELAKLTLDFFDFDYDEEEDIIDEVMKYYALDAIREATINCHNTKGVISDFNNKEGFASIDGSLGIQLDGVQMIEFETSELEVDIK